MVGTRAVRTVAQPSTTRKSQERVTPSSHRHPQSTIKRLAAKALGRESSLIQFMLGSCRTVCEDGQLRLLHQTPGRRLPDPPPARARSRCLLPCPPAFSARPAQRPRPVVRSEESQTQSTGLRKEKVQSWTHSDRPDVPPLVHLRKQPLLLSKHHRRPERRI